MSGVVHGGVTEGELAAARARGVELVDLSASVNPYGPHPEVIAAAQAAVMNRYPEPDGRTLRAAYAELAGVEPAQVLAGNGSTELLYLLARSYNGPAFIVGPTFGEYRAACEAVGHEVSELSPGPSLRHDVTSVEQAIAAPRPGLVFVCNPNNPTGQLWSAAEVQRIAEATRSVGGTLLVDEAYMDFAGTECQHSRPGGGVLVLRSLTKLHAIPGLRLGFLLGDSDAIARVARQQPSWSVNAAAAAAGLAALRLTEWEDDCRARVVATREQLISALRDAGLPFLASRANFVLLEAGGATAFRARMIEFGWVLRDCTSFGLPRHVRIAIPRDDQVAALVGALKECFE